ncbi:unnamed protein product [Linum tenue]|uniref:FBD domain-containing protein n=1 Tax=Linum tenue TaxID=586396 RepID=A0AAV0HPJ1_9ROSI|nr:unnamed protein product [Linum tenue]
MEAKYTKIWRPWPGIDGGDDRLSSLPDQIISYILSFMETKYAVGTEALSRRWEGLWTRVSNLDLDNRLVYDDSSGDDLKIVYASDAKRRDSQFCHFVDKVLGEHKNLNSLTRFRFHFAVEHRQYSTVLRRTRFKRELVFGPAIEEIDVRVCGETALGIPQCMRCIPENFYTLKNLKVARLSGVVLGAINRPVFLPSLKILQLSYVKMKDFESLGRIISGCPVLEIFHLESCHPSSKNESDRIEVSLPRLKNFKVSDYGNWDDPMCPIVIEAPNLEDLYLEHFAELQFKGKIPLSRLHVAHVDVGQDCRTSYHDVIRLLSQISNARKLSLSGETLVHLSAATDDDVRLPIFPNLTHLTIGIGLFGPTSWFLHSLLNSASKLQSLVIDMRGHWGVPLRWEGLETACTPHCLLSSLEEIEVRELVAYPDEKKMIAYLLKSGAVLRKVNMHVNSRFLELMGRKDLVALLKLPRRSSTCQVELFFPFEDDRDSYIGSDDESDTDDNVDDGDSDSTDDKIDCEDDASDSEEDSL